MFEKVNMLLVKIDIYIVTASVFRIIHFLHPPVPSLAGNREVEFSVPYDRLSIVDMAYTCDDLAFEFQMLGIDYCNDSIQLHVIVCGR